MRAWMFGFAFAAAVAGCGGDNPTTNPSPPPQTGDASDSNAPPDLGLAQTPDLGTTTSGCPGAGQPCSTGNACSTGVVRCTMTQSTCVDDKPYADGTPCGNSHYCLAGQCQSCTPGKSCNPTPCSAGVTDCSTGVEKCMPKSTYADGTSCGTDEVCKSGQCVACKAGGTCPSSGPCKTATISCATGAPVCGDSGNAPNGTSCGTNQVCQSGSCVACVEGGDCQPASSPCKKGKLSCATGAPVCVAQSDNEPDGMSCGSSYVCKSGACVYCSAGGSCTAPDVCKLGVYSCATGTQTCVDGANKANGTSCGSNMVCSNGVCGACTAGAACTPTNACHTGTTDCSTGTPVCKDSGSNVANGTSCGTNQYCYDGSCTTCVAGGTCTPSDPCQTGSYACASGQKVCVPSGPSGATSCGITTIGTCVGGACQCPTGKGIWNGDCAACPAFSNSGNFYVTADPSVATDNQCCGRTQALGFGGPCLTVTQAIKNIEEEALTSSVIWLRGDTQGNASPREVYPLVLPAGALLQTVINSCLPGASGKEVVHVEQTGSSSVSINTEWYLHTPNPTTLTLGTTCDGTASGASTGLFVGAKGYVHTGDLIVAKTARGVDIEGGQLEADAGELHINDVSGDGLYCQWTGASTSSSIFGSNGEQYNGRGWLVTARVGGRAVYASQGCNFQSPVTLGVLPPCGSPKKDGQGLVADGNAYVVSAGTVECMQGDGIALKSNAAFATNNPTVTFDQTYSDNTGGAWPSILQNNGCAGAYAEVGKLTLKGVHAIHNHWGVHQKSASVSTDPANALISAGPANGGFSSAPPQSRFACNGKSEPGACCTATSCPVGADAFNESGLVLYAENDEWEDSPVSVCNCNAQLQSCACSGGGTTPADGVDVITTTGGTTDVTNSKLISPAMSCN